MAATEEKRISTIVRHIANVRDDCLLMGERLIEQGEEELGRRLMANGMIHDNSKFFGIEWLYLHNEVKETNLAMFHMAIHQHVTTNLHHPEAWPGGIEDMPRLFLGEMIADWHSRSSEFGTDLMGWIRDTTTKKYKFSTAGRVYKELKFFVDILLEARFK